MHQLVHQRVGQIEIARRNFFGLMVTVTGRWLPRRPHCARRPPANVAGEIPGIGDHAEPLREWSGIGKLRKL